MYKRQGVYEPIHGSAHDIAGQGLANPLASVLSAALLLDISFGMAKEAQAVIAAVQAFLKEGYRTRDIADAKTSSERVVGTFEAGKLLLERLK